MFAALMLSVFVYVVLFKVFNINGDSFDISNRITLEESENIFREMGGVEGEKPLTVFVTNWCPSCKALESALKALKISYARAEIERDRSAALYYERVTQRRTSAIPVVLVGTKVFVGFQIEAILAARDEIPSKTGV